MSKRIDKKREKDESVSHENPLVPNKKMKQMYQGIVELRLLEDMLRKRSKKTKHPRTRGQEACRVSALIDLEPGDLISDTSTGIEAALVCGLPLHELVAHADATASGKKKDAASSKLNLSGLLPSAEDAADRVKLTLGAALAIKRLKLPHIVVLLAAASEMKLSAWHKSLKFAAREELPILFVVLPKSSAKSSKSSASAKPFELSTQAATAGIPGIPVDASDAVALYRVVQESIGRMRSGGGSVLMECIPFPGSGRKKNVGDPIITMGQTLLTRKICDEQWLAAVTTAFEARLNALA